MGLKINLQMGEVQVSGELTDSPTALAIGNALPLEVRVSTWGEEIYFTVPVKAGLDETAKELVDIRGYRLLAPGQRPLPVFRPDAHQRPG